MQVLLKSSNESVETRCSVCGQGFAMYWERQTRDEKAEALREVESTLMNHHRVGSGACVHPDHGFVVPEWDGPVAFSGAAILGNAPSWAL
jgi:hypothetical protein